MADDVDRANDYMAAEIAGLIARRAPTQAGSTECATCGEAITPLRRDLGARLCIDCQSDLEAQQRGHRR